MMSIDIEASVSQEPMSSMHVQVVATAFSSNKDKMPYVIHDCASYPSFCAAVDNFIAALYIRA
jgi:hypothetical protein